MHRLAMLGSRSSGWSCSRAGSTVECAALGYRLPRAEFFRQLGIGWAAGMGLMLPLVALLLALDVRQIKPGLGDVLPVVARPALRSGRRFHRRDVLSRHPVHRRRAHLQHSSCHRRTERVVRRIALPAASCACRRIMSWEHGFEV
jgi:hypothetical protein